MAFDPLLGGRFFGQTYPAGQFGLARQLNPESGMIVAALA